MLHIYIPTYRRPYDQVTYDQLPRAWREHTTFVVNNDDGVTLQRRYRNHPVRCAYPSDEACTSIAKKRAWILRHTPYTHIVMMDDDLRFFVREAEGVKLHKAPTDKLDAALHELDRKLDGVVHTGWSARQGNNRHPADWVENTRMMYVLGYDVPKVLQNCELGRIEHREDMDYTLQLLRNGFPNAVDFRIAADQRYNAPGGASSNRTIEASNADAEKLAELHPGLVRVVEKKYKSSLPRKEVVCSWKKAFQHDYHTGA